MRVRLNFIAICLYFLPVFFFAVGPALAAVDVPDKLKEFPLYSGSKIIQAMDMDNNAMLSATVKASPDSVSDFYKNGMKGKGWKLAMQMDQDNSKVLHFQKDNMIFQVTIEGEEQGDLTTYNLMVSSK